MMHVVATSVVDILLHAFGESFVCECPTFICVLFRLHPVCKRVLDYVFVVSSWMKPVGRKDSVISVAGVLEATCNAK